jgi:hypothetical protein
MNATGNAATNTKIPNALNAIITDKTVPTIHNVNATNSPPKIPSAELAVITNAPVVASTAPKPVNIGRSSPSAIVVLAPLIITPVN